MFSFNQPNQQDNSEQSSEPEAAAEQNPDNISAIDIGPTSQIEYPILNFFGGSQRTDRVEHENISRRFGLAHWKGGGRDAQSYTDQVEHAGFSPARGSANQVQRSTAGYGTSAQSPGMGLEGENLQSFITGSHHKIIPIDVPNQAVQTPQLELAPSYSQGAPQAQEELPAEVPQTHEELPSGAPAPAILFKFRRMKSKTFHKLLAMAMNE